MSLSLAITINALADVALAGGLAYVLSRTTRLTPHVSATHASASLPGVSERSAPQPRAVRTGAVRRPARPSSALGLLS